MVPESGFAAPVGNGEFGNAVLGALGAGTAAPGTAGVVVDGTCCCGRGCAGALLLGANDLSRMEVGTRPLLALISRMNARPMKMPDRKSVV